MHNKRTKIILFILLIIILIYIVLISIFGLSFSLLSEKEIKDFRTQKENLIKSLIINNLESIYDKSNDIYYYTVSDKYENKRYVLNLELEDGFKYKILQHDINVIKVDYEKPIKILLYNDKYYDEVTIQLTNLPLVSIDSKYEVTTDDNNATFKYINSNMNSMVNENIKIHIRGATSVIFPKKSYKIDIYNKKYNDTKDIQFSDFYYGSAFILQSLYTDPSKIRNVLATRLWNTISQNFTNITIDNEFVEVFINNEYKGLYVLSEPVNRKSLNLNKSSSTSSSVIIKSNSWNIISENRDYKNIDASNYLGLEIKYPNDEILYSQVWEKFLNKTSNYYDQEIEITDDIINNTFNTKNYVDLLIFNSFINNTDNNLIKNNYFYMKDKDDNEIYIEPWDMELSFGLGLSYDSETRSKKILDSYDDNKLIFYHEYASEINNMLINRYYELRKDVLTEENLYSLVDKYFSLLNNGAYTRDSDLWYEGNLKEEIKDIKKWIHNRIEYFDEYVGGLLNE